MKSEELAAIAKRAESSGLKDYQADTDALMMWAHALEERVEILREQADAKHDLREALAKADLRVHDAQSWLGFWIDKIPFEARPRIQDILYGPVHPVDDKQQELPTVAHGCNGPGTGCVICAQIAHHGLTGE